MAVLGPMFHGSPHKFSVGDVVTPQRHDEAYATSDPDSASNFGAVEGYRQTNLKSSEHKVFRVEPVDPSDVSVEKVYGAKHYKSKSGFKVVGEYNG